MDVMILKRNLRRRVYSAVFLPSVTPVALVAAPVQEVGVIDINK